jgi:hypothetical protein
MGGMLADPATKWPSTLGKIKLLRQHPYLLPCAVAASIALLTFVVAFIGLKEVCIFSFMPNSFSSVPF